MESHGDLVGKGNAQLVAASEMMLMARDFCRRVQERKSTLHLAELQYLLLAVQALQRALRTTLEDVRKIGRLLLDDAVTTERLTQAAWLLGMSAIYEHDMQMFVAQIADLATPPKSGEQT
jgi:hypothetical protein